MAETVDDFLAHYGVPGMKWGQRQTPQQRLAVVRRKQDRTNAKAALEGDSLRAYYRQKKVGKSEAKDPGFKYAKLNKEQKAIYERGVTKMAYRDLAARGVIDVGLGVAIGKIGGQKLFGLNSKNSNMAAGLIVGAATLRRVGEIREVVAAERSRKLIDEAMDLERQIKAAS